MFHQVFDDYDVIFAARCYASAALAVMRVCRSVCLTVRPSVTFVHSVETNKHIYKFFSPLCSQAILHVVFIARRHTDARY